MLKYIAPSLAVFLISITAFAQPIAGLTGVVKAGGVSLCAGLVGFFLVYYYFVKKTPSRLYPWFMGIFFGYLAKFIISVVITASLTKYTRQVQNMLSMPAGLVGFFLVCYYFVKKTPSDNTPRTHAWLKGVFFGLFAAALTTLITFYSVLSFI